MRIALSVNFLILCDIIGHYATNGKYSYVPDMIFLVLSDFIIFVLMGFKLTLVFV